MYDVYDAYDAYDVYDVYDDVTKSRTDILGTVSNELEPVRLVGERTVEYCQRSVGDGSGDAISGTVLEANVQTAGHVCSVCVCVRPKGITAIENK